MSTTTKSENDDSFGCKLESELNPCDYYFVFHALNPYRFPSRVHGCYGIHTIGCGLSSQRVLELLRGGGANEVMCRESISVRLLDKGVRLDGAALGSTFPRLMLSKTIGHGVG